MGDLKGIQNLVSSWVVSGIIAVSTVTFSLGALGRMVSDKGTKALDDFLVAPISRNKIFMSYIISTLVIALILSITLLVVSEIYIISSGGQLLIFSQLLKVLGIIILSVLSSSLLLLFIISFIATEQAFGIFSTIIGTIIGFITGAFVPIGVMPKAVQNFSNLIPVSQCASLLRKVFIDTPSKEIFGSSVQALSEYNKVQGVNLYLDSFELKSEYMIIYIIGTIIIFSIINAIRFKKIKI